MVENVHSCNSVSPGRGMLPYARVDRVSVNWVSVLNQ